jgi:hypothetical protein
MRPLISPLVLLFLAFASSLGAISSSPTSDVALFADSKTRLTARRVVLLADAAARRRKINLNLYSAPSVTFEPRSVGGRWRVAYSTKEFSLDGCFFLYVDDLTKNVSYEACG